MNEALDQGFSNTRREFLKRSAQILMGAGAAKFAHPLEAFGQIRVNGKIPTRPLGKTGHQVTVFSLGGEGVLRTFGRRDEAVRVINKALDLGVNYCDTSPVYAGSQDYYGEALGPRRKNIFLASKTHDRTREGTMRLIESSFKRLRTDHIDLLQLHDLRYQDDLDQIFGKGGAIEAIEEAKRQKMIRFSGVTGHQDPRILKKAIERYPFDTVLMACNAADKHYLSFIDIVLPKALEKNMGAIAMKVLSRGQIMRPGGIRTAKDAISYVLSLPVSTALIGCSTPEEVLENVETVKNFHSLAPDVMKEMERLTASYAYDATPWKAWQRF